MTPLPPGWTRCRLGDVVPYGTTAKVEPEQIPLDAWLVELEDIEKDSSRLINRVTCATRQPRSTKNRFEAGDVLYGKLRPYLNKVLLASQPGYCTTEIVPLRGNGRVEHRYLFHWLKSREFREYANAESHGINMPRLGTAGGLNAPLVLAPIAEQRHIADKLDALLGRMAACREHLARAGERTRRLRRHLLHAATDGSLTESWRQARTLPRWSCQPLAELVDDFSYGSGRKSQRAGATPVLRMGNIQSGRLDWSDLVYTSEPDEIDKYSLRPGDVLFNRTNSPELVGKTAVYHGERPAIYAGYLIRVRCRPALLPDYLAYCLNSPMGREYCRRVKSDGVSQSNINAQKLAAFDVPLPTIDEQHEIVRIVTRLIALADRIDERVRRARELINVLEPTVLAKAFRGELIAQHTDGTGAAQKPEVLSFSSSGGDERKVDDPSTRRGPAREYGPKAIARGRGRAHTVRGR